MTEVGNYYLSQLMLRKSWHLDEYIQADCIRHTWSRNADGRATPFSNMGFSRPSHELKQTPKPNLVW